MRPDLAILEYQKILERDRPRILVTPPRATDCRGPFRARRSRAPHRTARPFSAPWQRWQVPSGNATETWQAPQARPWRIDAMS